ncbi:hypothetical protein KGQ20_03830 [Catenulispora sp. NF23]|uniref:Uncharacterized protein n=1 Tax=Catenulispora pinistramenti TaxID=2705254 RepID=A0ABS5KMZ5_9ACTN|nr:hypothetical protein [Catenulispora pinistramenti]MBS2531896.1 hypothetical protein [Catenulispora pinistramenti]MBS2547375.1 hypothetical protein [Catenulispora pinistramenti]
MARPADWTPLRDSDPAPGDTDSIRDQVTKLTRVADSILDQVAALRRITSAGADGELRGQFVGTIGSKAGDLAVQLGKAEGRYRTASSELRQWLNALEPAQGRTLTLLTSAKQAWDAMTAKGIADPDAPPPPSFTPHPPPSAPKPSAPPAIADELLDPWKDPAVTQAHAALLAARHEAAQIAADLDAEAARHEKNIKAASQHDGLKDSRWDRLKAATHSGFGRLLSDCCNGLGWIATGLAIAALFFPGVDLLVIGAFAVTALSAVGHGVLASTGAGSLFDVGMDTVGLLSFGVGTAVGKSTEAAVGGLKATLSGGEAVAGGAKGAATAAKDGKAVTTLAGLTKPEDIADVAKQSSTLDSLNEPVADEIAQSTKNVSRELINENFRFKDAGFLRPTLDSIWQGGHKAAAMRAWTKEVTLALGDDPDVASGVAKVTRQLNTAQAAYLVATGADATDKIYGSTYPYLGVKQGTTYNRITRSPFTYIQGSSW